MGLGATAPGEGGAPRITEGSRGQGEGFPPKKIFKPIIGMGRTEKIPLNPFHRFRSLILSLSGFS